MTDMIRTLIGGLVAGLIIFVMGYVFWATPLSDLAYSKVEDAQQAAVHTSLAQNLPPNGAGTFRIPDPSAREGAALYAQGPVATVNYNSRGFAPEDMSMILPGFIMALLAGLLMAFGLAQVGGGGRGFGPLARLVVLYSLGFTVWEFLATPIFNHYGWGFWIYGFVAETLTLIAAGLVVARWFLPSYRAAPATAGHAEPQPHPATEA